MKTSASKGFFISIFAISLMGGISLEAQANHLHRLSADFLNFDGTETFTSVIGVADCSSSPCVPGSPDGQLFYRKKVKIPDDDNVLYVTFVAQGDTHGGAALRLSCRLNDAFCNPGTGLTNAGNAGWVTLLKLPVPNGGSSNCNDGGGGAGDCHDNGITYSWCIPLTEYNKYDTVDLKLATSIAGQSVFFERAHVFIDSNKIDKKKNQCAAYTLPPFSVTLQTN